MLAAKVRAADVMRSRFLRGTISGRGDLNVTIISSAFYPFVSSAEPSPAVIYLQMVVILVSLAAAVSVQRVEFEGTRTSVLSCPRR